MKRLVTFGCSNTQGQGLENPKEEVWGAVLASHLGRVLVNVGKQGASNKYIAYSIEQFNFLPNDLVIISWSFLNRYSIIHDPKDFDENEFVTDILPSHAIEDETSGVYYYLFHNDYDSNFLNKAFIDYSIDLLLYKQVEFKQIYWSRDESTRCNCRHKRTNTFPFFFVPFYDNYPRGIDNAHMGKKGNRALGYAMYNHIVSK